MKYYTILIDNQIFCYMAIGSILAEKYAHMDGGFISYSSRSVSFPFLSAIKLKKPFEIKIYYSIRFFEHQDWPNLEGSFSLILRPIHQDNTSHSAWILLLSLYDF